MIDARLQGHASGAMSNGTERDIAYNNKDVDVNGETQVAALLERNEINEWLASNAACKFKC